MSASRRCRAHAALITLALLVGCGGGERPADVVPSAVQPAPVPVAGPDEFLLFPNPQVTPDGVPPAIDSTAYAQAYYAAIDPDNTKDTLAKWKAANGFDQSGGVQVSAVFGDFRDLGYGRRMTARQNPDNTVAFVVENYVVNPGGGGYGAGINIDAAVVQDRQWRVSINAIEFSPGKNGTVKYAKFYSFDPATGERKLRQDLDGRGEKALPGACISCHGGRGDPLTRDGRFPLLQNSEPAQRGDTRGRLHLFELDALSFAATPGFTRAEQEGVLKTMNKMVLCSYPYTAAAAPTLPEDLCRQQDTTGREWQAAAADLIKEAYGGNGLPAATFGTPGVPAGWAARVDLYQRVVVPACRSCHIVRGTGQQSDIDFASFAKFDGYAARTKYHVFDRGNMPLSKVVFDRFWSTEMAGLLANYLDTRGGPSPARDAGGAVLKPGHPFADPGPDRRVALGATQLGGGASKFNTSFRWSIVPGPGGAVPASEASLTNADTAVPTFTAGAAAAGKRYTLQLVVGNGSTESAAAPLTLYVNTAFDAAPASIGFAQVRQVLNNSTCLNCHAAVTTAPRTFAPSLTNTELHNVLRGVVNFGNVGASPLLGKPAGSHHNGGKIVRFDTAVPTGDPARTDHDTVLSWILNGAPGP